MAAVSNEYQERLDREKQRFDAEVCVHDLPDIFHYWSNNFLKPFINDQGYDSLDDFFVREIRRVVPADGSTIRIASVGCGDCAVEAGIARLLEAGGTSNFHFTCLDLSDGALGRGEALVSGSELHGRFSFVIADFNEGLPAGQFDVVMANQSLHHVMGLEDLFQSIRDQLSPTGRFVVSDIIGRNGHQRWPEARELVDEAWQWLPSRYRYNWQLQRQEEQFLDWDCSQESCEGIRAEDVLPLLLQYFSPRVFIAWGNIIDIFIDRCFGHNFRQKNEWDLHFIERIHAIDSAAIASGRIKPTHLLASFGRDPGVCIHADGMSPAQAVRVTHA